MNVLIALIVLLNLLIAIMGDTFDRVMENSENNMLRELAAIMSENEMLINRDKKFEKYKYIIVVEIARGEESQVHWDGRLQRLREYLDQNVKKNSKIKVKTIIDETLKNMQNGILGKIKSTAERIADGMEDSSQRRISSISNKIDDIDMYLQKITKKIDSGNINLK